MRQQKTGIFLKLKSVDSIKMSHLNGYIYCECMHLRVRAFHMHVHVYVYMCVCTCSGDGTHALHTLSGNSTT